MVQLSTKFHFAAVTIFCLAEPAAAATLPPIYDASIYHGGKWSPAPVIEAAPVQGNLWPLIGSVSIIGALLLLFDGGGDSGKRVLPSNPEPSPVPLPSSIWLMLAAATAMFWRVRT